MGRGLLEHIRHNALRGGVALSAATVLGFGTLWAASPAQAFTSQVFISNGQLTVQSAAESNWITVTPSSHPVLGPTYRVTETRAGGALTAGGSQCQAIATNVVECASAAVVSMLLAGGDGDDSLQWPTIGVRAAAVGGPGADFLEPGPGRDNLLGGDGVDTVSYRTRLTPVSLSLDNAGNDGASGELDFISSDVENLTGGQADDVLIGDAGANRLSGWGGDDRLVGGPGGDELQGAAGTDTADYSARFSPLSVTIDNVANDGEAGEQDNVEEGTEVVLGGSGADTVTGNDFQSNTLLGGPGNDKLTGGMWWEDTLDGGPGADTMSGEGRDDLVTYESRTAPVVVTLNSLANDGEAGEHDKVLPDVEQVRGGSGDDQLSGSSAANRLEGGPGNDALNGSGGNDTVSGGDGNDKVGGGGGNDVLVGGFGADAHVGGGGVDNASYADTEVPLVVSIDGAANDGAPGEGDNVKTDVETLTGGAAGDRLTGSGDAETLVGGFGNDQLFGLGGADVLTGGIGSDDLNGGAGSDTASYADHAAGVIVSLDGAANDGTGAEVDNARTDLEKVEGSVYDDLLIGGTGANTLLGSWGNDVLDGGLGPDQLYGGFGVDAVTYAARVVPIVVKLDNDANDGQAGEKDLIRTDVEEVRGGTANDKLTGSARPDRLFGGFGDDFLSGLAGNDLLDGQDGFDTVDGGADPDTCSGESLTNCP